MSDEYRAGFKNKCRSIFVIAWCWTALTNAAGVAIGQSPFAGDWHIESERSQQINAELSYRIDAPELNATCWYVMIPVLPETGGQTRVRSKLPGSKTLKELGPLGRSIHAVILDVVPGQQKEAGPQHMVVTASMEATLLKRKLVPGQDESVAKPLSREDKELFLTNNPTCDFENSTFQEWLTTNSLRIVGEERPLDFAYRSFVSLRQLLTYRCETDQNRKASQVCRDAWSDCGGISNLYVATLRANGIPARILPVRMAKSGIGVSAECHVRSEFFVDEIGWIPTEITSAVAFKDSPVTNFFGNDPGDHLVFHLDSDVLIKHKDGTERNIPFGQWIDFWADGGGTWKDHTRDVNWRVQAVDDQEPTTGGKDGSTAENRDRKESENPFLPFDQLLAAFISEHKVPGAALAIGKDGKLIYEQGYGFADVERGEKVARESRFRIASVSKPITAVAILTLVESGKLNLDDTLGDIFRQSLVRESFDRTVSKITVKQLLQHTGGWDRLRDAANEFDPMFRLGKIGRELGLTRPATRDEMMYYMFSRPPDFEPGTRFAYSNFGYCVLGRIIEVRGGKNYFDYVREHVAVPLAMKSLELGRSHANARLNGEVKYYVSPEQLVNGVAPGTEGTRVPIQYGGWVQEYLDAHGGWICSAGDLVRFATAFDIPASSPILSRDSIKEMFARPNGNKDDHFYGLGWHVRPVGKDPETFNSWHMGTLDGSSAILVRRSDGLSWAVVFNSRNSLDDKPLCAVIDPLLHDAAKQVRNWPHRGQ